MNRPVPVAWVAGVIDARGHIEVVDRHGRGQPRIRVTTARTALLHRLADLTGTTVKVDARGYQRRPCGSHCDERHSHVARQSAYWNVDSARATIVLANVLPYLVDQHAAARTAMLTGTNVWPPARGDTAKRMAGLGWDVNVLAESRPSIPNGQEVR